MASGHVYHRRFAAAARTRLEKFRRRTVGLAEGFGRREWSTSSCFAGERGDKDQGAGSLLRKSLNLRAMIASARAGGSQRSTRNVIAMRRGKAAKRLRDATAFRMR